MHNVECVSYLQGRSCVGIFPGFALNVVISGTEVKFEPDPSGFEVSGLSCYLHMHLHAHACMHARTHTSFHNPVNYSFSFSFSFSFFHQVLVTNVFDKMVSVVSSVPRVETKLYPPNEDSSAPSKPNLTPIVAAELLQDAKAKVMCTCAFLRVCTVCLYWGIGCAFFLFLFALFDTYMYLCTCDLL